LTLAAILAVVGGLLHAASIATPWNGAPSGSLQLAALGLLALLLQRSHKPAQGAWLGWLFATSWLCGTFWWMYVAMVTYAGLPGWLAAFAIFALAGVLSLYSAAAGAAFVALQPASRIGAAIVFASLWMFAELARGVWFTGFGWGAAGYAHIDGIARSARIVGAYGVTALVAFIAALAAFWLVGPDRLRRLWMPALALILAIILALPPGVYTRSVGNLPVALLQGNIAQDVKFQPGTGVTDALRWYGEQLSAASAALVVAPETAIPLLPQELPDNYWAGLRRLFERRDQAALLGIPLRNAEDGYTNSVVGFKPGAPAPDGIAPYRYDKHHLVPFGEFIPPMFRWFTRLMNIPLGDFDRGSVEQASFEWRGQRLAPNICFEDLFGEELAQRFTDPAKAPTIFVNVSNIGWFGNTVIVDQHLNISRMRALEFERPFIRATNTGDTVIIDHDARVTHALPRYTRGVLIGDVQGRAGITPYAWWVSRFGLWPLWFLAALVVLGAVMAKRRHPRDPP
jgi:apolipoprotein N-acyltransferase